MPVDDRRQALEEGRVPRPGQRAAQRADAARRVRVDAVARRVRQRLESQGEQNLRALRVLGYGNPVGGLREGPRAAVRLQVRDVLEHVHIPITGIPQLLERDEARHIRR